MDMIIDINDLLIEHVPYLNYFQNPRVLSERTHEGGIMSWSERRVITAKIFFIGLLEREGLDITGAVHDHGHNSFEEVVVERNPAITGRLTRNSISMMLNPGRS